MEKVIETKQCKNCDIKFEITDYDLAFYDKVSPIFGGKKYSIPIPTFCPDCRQQKRLAFRNERKLYKRKCDMTDKDIVSLYSQDKPYKVYDQKVWRGDKRDPLKYGKDYDFNRSFFEQFKDLQEKVPRLSIFNLKSTNSEYTNHSSDNKNCYMGVAFGECEDCMYGHWLTHCNYCIDGLYLEGCQLCYQCSYCIDCYETFFSQYCENVKNSILCFECKDCQNCIACVQLQHKEFHILNQEVSAEEFEKVQRQILHSPEYFKEIQEKFDTLKLQKPRRYSHQINCHNCTGNDLYNCKNSFYSFNCRNNEDCKYMFDQGNVKNSMDVYEHGRLTQSDLIYESHAGMTGYHFLFCNICSDSRNLLYCDLCLNNSADLFACVGLKNKQHCILNKQYTKEEYEQLVPKIIEKMKQDGERGKFFPGSISHFGYNETAVQEYYPLTKDEALKQGFKRSDYEATFPQVEKTLKADELQDISEVTDEILNQAIICELSGKPFRIIKTELEFYRKHGLPLPHKHPDVRHIERMKLRNPRKLCDRKCMKCGVDIKTIYSPERPEIVYCEACYNREVYG